MRFCSLGVVVVALVANIVESERTTPENSTSASFAPVPIQSISRQPRPRKRRSTVRPTTPKPTKAPILATFQPTHRRRPGQPSVSPAVIADPPFTPSASPVSPTVMPIAPVAPVAMPVVQSLPTSKPVSLGATCNICGPGLFIGNPGGILTVSGNCSQYQKLGNAGSIPTKLCSALQSLATVPCNCTMLSSP